MKDSNIKISSNKSFGIVFFIFFLIVAIFPLINDDNVRIWSLVVSFIFLVLGFLNSRLLTPLNKLWFKFGILLGNFVSPIVMSIVFFIVITPTSLIMKLLGKNLLNLKRKNKTSYWIERQKLKSSMKDQF